MSSKTSSIDFKRCSSGSARSSADDAGTFASAAHRVLCDQNRRHLGTPRWYGGMGASQMNTRSWWLTAANGKNDFSGEGARRISKCPFARLTGGLSRTAKATTPARRRPPPRAEAQPTLKLEVHQLGQPAADKRPRYADQKVGEQPVIAGCYLLGNPAGNNADNQHPEKTDTSRCELFFHRSLHVLPLSKVPPIRSVWESPARKAGLYQWRATSWGLVPSLVPRNYIRSRTPRAADVGLEPRSVIARAQKEKRAA